MDCTDAETRRRHGARGRRSLDALEAWLTVRGVAVFLCVAYAALGVYALWWPREGVVQACARQQPETAAPPAFEPLVWDAEHLIAKYVVAPLALSPALDVPCLVHLTAAANGSAVAAVQHQEQEQQRAWRHAAGLLCRLAAWDARTAARFVALYAPECRAAYERAPTAAARAALHGLVQLHRQGGVYVGGTHTVPVTALDTWGRDRRRPALVLEHGPVCRALRGRGADADGNAGSDGDSDSETVVVAAQTHPLVYEALQQLAAARDAAGVRSPVAVLGRVVAAQLARDPKHRRALQALCAHPDSTAEIAGVLLLPHGHLNPYWNS